MVTSILFVCHGNICRSPMAESVLAYLLKQGDLQAQFSVASAAAHTDEIGNPPHRGTREVLKKYKIPLVDHRARLLTREDGETFDYIIGMDDANVRDILRIVGENRRDKVYRLLDFTPSPRAIADPWYTGNFEETFRDVYDGCLALLSYLTQG